MSLRRPRATQVTQREDCTIRERRQKHKTVIAMCICTANRTSEDTTTIRAGYDFAAEFRMQHAITHYVESEQEAQLSLTNRTMMFCKVVEVLQDVLSD